MKFLKAGRQKQQTLLIKHFNKCIQRKPSNRLGVNGPNEIRQHIWMKDFDWKKLLDKELESQLIMQKVIIIRNSMK